MKKKNNTSYAPIVPEGLDIKKDSNYFNNHISGKEAFDLYQTFGFPPELIDEELANYGFTYNKHEFKEEMQKHQELSRAGAEQKFKGGLADSSEATTALHSATHIMLAGLRKYLGKDVHQKGSNITAERLRFDFNYGEKVPDEILRKVEDYVNEVISKNCKMLLEEIKKIEAEKDPTIEGSFWEKYPEVVKVYTLKDSEGKIYSRELCGGPHVENTSNMGKFRILKEESSSAGVRRIKAVLEK